MICMYYGCRNTAISGFGNCVRHAAPDSPAARYAKLEAEVERLRAAIRSAVDAVEAQTIAGVIVGVIDLGTMRHLEAALEGKP